MLYLCIPSHDEAATVGLLLWKIRKTFQAFPREYEILVADDASSDTTADVLEPYAKVLPLTIVRHGDRHGYARSLEALLRLAVERTDRPKRDAVIVMHADFAHGPEYLPELVKRLEGGSDIITTEATLAGQPSRGIRWVRQGARFLLRGVSVPGVKDICSGFTAYRLMSVKSALRAQAGPLLTTDGWTANAELLARVACHARRIDVVPVVERHDLRPRASRLDAWPLAKQLWQDGGRLRIKAPRNTEGRRAAAPRSAEDQELEEVTS